MKKIFYVWCVQRLWPHKTTGRIRKTRLFAEERDSLTQVINDKVTELNEIINGERDSGGLPGINEAEGRITVNDGNMESETSKQAIRGEHAVHSGCHGAKPGQNQLLKEKLVRVPSGGITEKDGGRLVRPAWSPEAKGAGVRSTIGWKGYCDSPTRWGHYVFEWEREYVDGRKQGKNQTVTEQDKQLHTAWYVFGTKSELKEQKILQKGDAERQRFVRDILRKWISVTTKSSCIPRAPNCWPTIGWFL